MKYLSILFSVFILANSSAYSSNENFIQINNYITGLVKQPAKVQQRRFILTGGPCVGKTSIIKKLEAKGHAVVYEAAADVIKERLAQGVKEPWLQNDFNEAISALIYQRQQEVVVNDTPVVFFDRGPVDPLSYARYFKTHLYESIIKRVQDVIDTPFYEVIVFLIAPLDPELYKNNEIRHESIETAEELGEYLARDYEKLGFKVVRVPFASIENRAEWILDYINNASKSH